MAEIKVIAFDADDTLWVNENYFREAEDKFSDLLIDYLPKHTLERELQQVEINNLDVYGYGVKSFMLSMIETAVKVTEGTIGIDVVNKILELGREMINQPVILLDGVEDVLEALKGRYRLVMATKGDLLHQQQKLINSGLEDYFHHIEIVSEKREEDYRKLVAHLDILPEQFLMIGNSLRSDILPVLNIGAHAYHVPYSITWAHEHIDKHIEHDNFRELDSIRDVLQFL